MPDNRALPLPRTRMRSHALAGSLCVMSACSQRVAAPSALPALPVAVVPKAAVARVVEAWESEPGTMLVGAAEGLSAVSADGAHTALVSPGPALHPRWLDREHVLVVSAGDPANLQLGARFERVQRFTGERELLARLPEFACGQGSESDAGDYNYLDVQDGRDFYILHDSQTACATLMDRNANMANVSVEVELDMKHGTIARRMTSQAWCKTPDGVEEDRGDGACHGAPATEATNNPRNYPYAFENERLFAVDTDRKQTTKLTLREYGPENVSPSGRWVVIGGDPEEHDYLYRRLIILDRERGILYPLPEKAGPWPAEVGHAGAKARRLPLPIEAAPLLPRETETRWLGDADAEVLVVDSLIVRPGAGAFLVPGEVAR